MESKTRAAVSQYVIPDGCNLKDVIAFPYGCLLGRREGLTVGSTAGNVDIMDIQIKRDAQVG